MYNLLYFIIICFNFIEIKVEVVKTIENKLKTWKDTKEFKRKLEKIYINEKGINFMREFYK